ncbi:MAG TPA: DUF397 domain-containing protein [Pseudonocardiaceae bacterium]
MATPNMHDLRWRTSSYSGNQGQCVEIATMHDGAAIRDSKNPTGGTLMLTGSAWKAFRTTVKA